VFDDLPLKRQLCGTDTTDSAVSTDLFDSELKLKGFVLKQQTKKLKLSKSFTKLKLK